ncbi:MAG: thioredoxin domain-containing protein [Candidatus Binataceae bacterium]
MSHSSPPPDRKPNRLINEQSPYLRQHAYNPVDWYPWGEEALARARAENKPILLSIGYSACHWCHVMERESFENEAIARLMNENFVPIKVDREERPDLDQIYMDAVQLLTGHGGWPLTVFLTPETRPFYGGTYYPPEDRRGMPGFARVLTALADAYHNKPDDIRSNVDRLRRAIASMGETASGGAIRSGLAAAAAAGLASHYDSTNGGVGAAPKFPNTFVFALFLRVFAATGKASYAEMVRHTLTKMAKGGIYDQIGGGFHRYSVDERWLVPHFEKMLYDNALLARLYLDAGRALDEPEFLNVTRETLDYVLREMTSPEGGFYSSQDADSEGEEGKFFVWQPAELQKVLGDDLAKIAGRYFDVSEEGNFEGGNILHRTISVADAARMFHVAEPAMAAMIADARARLFAAREPRVHPGRDDKILAAWNGMMIGAFAEGYRALGDERYRTAAIRAADFAMTTLWDGHALRRSCKDGVARFNAYLEDYAMLAGAMLDTYEASLDARYLEHAKVLAGVMLERFEDRENGGFFFTSDDHEALITRSKAAFDGSTPSGNSAAVMALLRLYAYTGNESYMKAADLTLCQFAPQIEKQPFAFAHMIEAADLYERGPTEIALVGDRTTGEFAAWLKQLGRLHVANLALYAVSPTAGAEALIPEALRGKRQVDGRLTAYLCRDRACSAPITEFAELERALRQPASRNG